KSESSMAGGRGYNFLEVVRWFAKRADLILLLFDPDRPGTTGESLDVLTRSMAGLDHKFVIILNKVDQLDSSVDFARAYGTLGWALSKVIPRKDIPQIYTMYNSGVDDDKNNGKVHKLPLEAFRKKREEVVAEVLRAKTRHWDNVITATEDTLRQLEMVATVTGAVRQRVRKQSTEMLGYGVLAFGLPGLTIGRLLQLKWTGPAWVPASFWAAYAVIGYGAGRFILEYIRQFEQIQVADLDRYFEEAYAWFFIHVDAEDLRGRWSTVRPRAANILRHATSITKLPFIARWEISRPLEAELEAPGSALAAANSSVTVSAQNSLVFDARDLAPAPAAPARCLRLVAGGCPSPLGSEAMLSPELSDAGRSEPRLSGATVVPGNMAGSMQASASGLLFPGGSLAVLEAISPDSPRRSSRTSHSSSPRQHGAGRLPPTSNLSLDSWNGPQETMRAVLGERGGMGIVTEFSPAPQAWVDSEAWRQRTMLLEDRLQQVLQDRAEAGLESHNVSALHAATPTSQRHRQHQPQSSPTVTVLEEAPTPFSQRRHILEDDEQELALQRAETDGEAWRRRGMLLEERLQETAAERDRMIEATNELRADIRRMAAATTAQAALGAATPEQTRALWNFTPSAASLTSTAPDRTALHSVAGMTMPVSFAGTTSLAGTAGSQAAFALTALQSSLSAAEERARRLLRRALQQELAQQ
ncbi:unnamed protein product, partial [Polarella glacialis]